MSLLRIAVTIPARVSLFSLLALTACDDSPRPETLQSNASSETSQSGIADSNDGGSTKNILAIRPAENNGPPDKYGHWIGRNLMTSTSVELVWSTIEGESVTYRIHRFKRNAGFNPETATFSADSEVYSGNASKWIDRDIIANQFYTYVLDAEVNGKQLPRRWTEALTADDTQAPTAITGLKANVSPQGVLLSWNKSSDNVEFAAYSVSIVEESRLKYIGGGADIEQTSFLDNRPRSGLVIYAVVAVDFHNNRTEAATISVNIP